MRNTVKNRRQYIWAKIELTNGCEKWYCISRVLRESLLIEKENNRFWKKEMIGNYITVATTEYVQNRAHLTVGKVKKISVSSHGTHSWNWTRNQFVTPSHLLDFKDAYNYLRHDYSWYNRFAIWVALRYWHNKLVQVRIKKLKKSIGRARWRVGQIKNKAKKRDA